MRKTLLLTFIATLPLFARSAAAPVNLATPTGTIPGFTMAPGNDVCRRCHQGNDLNPAGGSIRIETGNFRPGIAQTVKVTIAHPDSARWGFQITARWARDMSLSAGRFTSQSGDVQEQLEGEYATHTAEGTVTGANGTKTFEFLWTPPAGAADGDIILFAAGNAANNSGNNQGDRIYAGQARVQAESNCGFSERPTISSVVDAGGFNPGVSSRALVTIRGANFGPVGNARVAHAGYIRNNQFPTELECVSVEIGGQKAPILFAGNNQINVQAPVLTGTGDMPVRVLMNPGRPNEVASATATARIQNFSPAFFTFNGRSVAALVAGTSTIVADPSLAIAGSRAARPGEIVELYATGLGATQTAVAPGAVSPGQAISTTGTVTVTIGGTAVTPMYAGLAPGNISGLYQINVPIPANAANGDLPIAMAIGGEQSVAGTTIPVRAQ
jgi:uncharacterized protein (TIGR03437 family)